MDLPHPHPGSSPGAAQEQHGEGTHNSDHLANERTFLAWIRTSVSVIGLGFVVAKFTVWLHELAARLDQQTPTQHSRWSLPLGIAMMVFGALLAIIAAWRYRKVKAAIDRDQPVDAETTTTAVAIAVSCIAVALIVYMLATAG